MVKKNSYPINKHAQRLLDEVREQFTESRSESMNTHPPLPEDELKDIKLELRFVNDELHEMKMRLSLLPTYGGIATVLGILLGISMATQIIVIWLLLR